MVNLIQPITVHQAYDEIGDGGWLMMTIAADSPLRGPNGLQISPPKEEQGLAVAPYHKTR